MATEDPDALPVSHQRLVELLAVLGTEAVVSRADVSADLVWRLRRQQDTRAVLLVSSSLAAAVATGLAGLFPRPAGKDGPT